MQQYANEQQCEAVKQVVVDLRTQLDALRSFKDQEMEAERKSTLKTTELMQRLQEFEAQLVDMRVQRDDAIMNMKCFKNNFDVERTNNQQTTLVISELERERDVLNCKIEGLERQIRAANLRSQFRDIVDKVRVYLDRAGRYI